MPLKNIAKREDIDPGVLRQRRDFYAIAIGLLLFNLAGGHLNPDATFATLLPIKFAVPQVLFWAAWFGFGYFLWRFWLMEPNGLDQFWKEVGLQGGNRREIKKFAADMILASAPKDHADNMAAVLGRRISVIHPGLVRHKNRIRLQISQIRTPGSGHASGLGEGHLDFPPELTWRVRWAALKSVGFAMVYERSFSDYVVPYLFAALCIAVQLYRFAFHPEFLGTDLPCATPGGVVAKAISIGLQECKR